MEGRVAQGKSLEALEGRGVALEALHHLSVGRLGGTSAPREHGH